MPQAQVRRAGYLDWHAPRSRSTVITLVVDGITIANLAVLPTSRRGIGSNTLIHARRLNASMATAIRLQRQFEHANI